MDAGSATLTAAVLAFGAALWQHRSHWKETRRDKLRDAYAAWFGALMALRRMDEAVMETTEMSLLNSATQAALGNPTAQAEVAAGILRVTPDMIEARRRQHAAQVEEDMAFGLIALLDTNEPRVLAAQELRRMEVFISRQLGQPPQTMEDFHERWGRQELALGAFLRRANRELHLERSPTFAWDFLERLQVAKEDDLRSRLRVDKLGRRPDARTKTAPGPREGPGQTLSS